MYLSETQRAQYLKIVLCLSLVIGLLLSKDLWLSDRLLPFAPILDSLPDIDAPFDIAFFWSLVLLPLAIIMLQRPRRLILLLIGLLVYLALLDINRLQPWVYMYALMLGALALPIAKGSQRKLHPDALDLCRFILVATYVWSGLQKMHIGFAENIFPWLAQPLLSMFGLDIEPSTVFFFGWVAASMEVIFGMALLFPLWRRVAVLALGLMHVFIFISLGPLGANWNMIVWPWNIAMALMVALLFWGRPKRGETDPHLFTFTGKYHRLVLVLVGILPALSFLGLWDSYLSMSLYSGNIDRASIQITRTVLNKLPEETQELFRSSPQLRIDMTVWGVSAVNVPVYPEERVYRRIALSLCGYAKSPQDVKLFLVRKKTLLRPAEEAVFDCFSLL